MALIASAAPTAPHTTVATGEASPGATPHFQIDKVYLKDASVEVPHSHARIPEGQPQLDFQLQAAWEQVGDDGYEVVLRITLRADITSVSPESVDTASGSASQAEGAGTTTMFLVEAAQAGIFQLRGFPPEALEHTLRNACANMLYPYLRTTVADLVMRAGFPPVMLSPANLEMQARP